MIRNSTNSLSIKPKLPAKIVWLILAVGFVVLFGLLYFVYTLGVKSGHQQYASDRATIEQLNSKIQGLTEKLDNSDLNLTIAQRHKQIQDEAYKQISKAYASSEEKNRYLGSRLDFYRSIISPESGETGPMIQSANIKKSVDSVAFDVTLVQAIKHKHQVRGVLSVELHQGHELLSAWPDSEPRSINFQYFQKVSGVFEGVTLDDVKIKGAVRLHVILKLQGAEPIVRWFDIAE